MIKTKELIHTLREGNCPLPVYWLWDKDNKPIFLQSLLRNLKNRRATFLADDAGQKSIVKLFYHKQGIQHARREVKGLALLQQCEVPTSQVLHCDVLKEGVLLVLSYLQETKPLSACWAKLSDSEKKETLLKLLAELKKLYEKGVYQCDLHLNNILLNAEQLYIVDGMDVRQPKANSLSAQLDNFAVLFLQFSFSDQALLWGVLADSTISLPTSQLKKHILARSLYQQRKVKAKVWRECSRFVTGQFDDYQYSAAREEKTAFIQLFEYLRKTENSYFCLSTRTKKPRFGCRLRAILMGKSEVYKGVNEHFSHQNCVQEPPKIGSSRTMMRMLKQGRTNTVFHYQYKECNWVIKRYNIKSLAHGLGRSVRRTRAAVSWQNANVLESLHILTPKPIGILQKKWGSWHRQAYFVMAYLEGQSLKQYLQALPRDSERQYQIIKQVAQTLNALKQNRLCHGDLKADNWWVCKDKLYLLDLDSLKTYRFGLWFQRAFKRDLKRFLRNWEDMPALQQTFIKIFEENQLL